MSTDTTDIIGTDPRSAVFQRQPDLTQPTYLVDDTEPFAVQYQRVQLQAELWEHIRRYEEEHRRLDAQVAAIRRRETAEVEQQRREEAGLDPVALQQRADRLREQREHQRRGRVELWARQRGLTYHYATSTDERGDLIERHLLTAPQGHPDLGVPPWKTFRPVIHAGQVLVPTVRDESLQAVEQWLGLPSDPAKSGTPQPTPHPATLGRWP